jgi:hypothetical protein
VNRKPWNAAALVPLQLPQPLGKRITPPSAALAEVQSWNVATATGSCRASLPGPPSARTCTPLQVRALGTRIRTEVALGRRFAVWAKGGSVFGLDMATGHVLRLHTGRFAPQGLVITAGRLLWWVNVRGHGHILRLRLP